MSEPDLIALVEKMKLGDKSAFGLVYDRYSQALLGAANNIVKHREIAEDVLQDSFVKIWKKCRLYDSSKGTFFTWMFRIVKNTAIDKYRSSSYQREIQTLGNSVNTHEGQAELGTTEQKTDAIGLGNLLKALDPKSQKVIEYVYFLGYSHADAAKELDMPLGSVKTKVRNALRDLRKNFVT